MGLIKLTGFVLCSILLFLLLVVVGFFFSVSLSLDYEVIKPEIKGIILDVVSSNGEIANSVENSLPAMKSYCSENLIFEYFYSGKNVSVPCSVVKSSFKETADFITFQHPDFSLGNKALADDVSKNYQKMTDYCLEHQTYSVKDESSGFEFVFSCSKVWEGSEVLIDYAVESLISEVYYKEYDCSFLDCFKKTDSMYFLISLHSQEYFKRKAVFFSLLALVIFGLMFFLLAKKSIVFIVSGALLIISSFSIKGFSKYLLSLTQKQLFGGAIEINLFEFLNPFFIKLPFIAAVFLISGIIFCVVGILFILHYFNVFSRK
jgi:hypothetical protein